MKTIGHGSRAGYQQHILMDIPMHDSCGCRAANNAYMSTYIRGHYNPAKRRARYLKEKEHN